VKSEWCRTVGLTKSAGLLIYHVWPPEIQFYNLRSFEAGTACLRNAVIVWNHGEHKV